MRFHAPTALVTLGVVGLVAILSAQNIVGSPEVNVRVVEPATVYTPAHPRNLVRIVEGQPYAVPSGRLLVVTSLGHNRPDTGNYLVTLRINGIDETNVFAGSGTGLHAQLFSLAGPGVVAGPGATVEVVGGDTNPDDGRAWGYLADN